LNRLLDLEQKPLIECPMIDIMKFIELFGKLSSDQKLIQYFQKNNIPMFSYETNEFDPYAAHIECHQLGIGFSFDGIKPIKTTVRQDQYLDEFVFNGIFLYAEGKDGYSQFMGDIPYGVSFSMFRNDLISLLGDPVFSRWRVDSKDSVSEDTWNLENIKVGVNYKQSSEIAFISISPISSY